jgi:hypothetical protein
VLEMIYFGWQTHVTHKTRCAFQMDFLLAKLTTLPSECFVSGLLNVLVFTVHFVL